MNPIKNKAASHASGRRPCLEVEREKDATTEGPAQATSGDEGDPQTSRTRARCRNLLIGHLTEEGMHAFLRDQQPDLEYRTGEELLESYPDELLRHLRAYEPNPHADE